jgi:hypothetical protein
MEWSFSLNNFGVRLSLQSWRWCLRCCSTVFSSKWMQKVEQNLCESSQAVWLQATGGPGAHLISPFNVKWRCSAPAGVVVGSMFCLFSVVLPARCVSSISPRFHYRRHAFCFLLLAAILNEPRYFQKKTNHAGAGCPTVLWLTCRLGLGLGLSQ